MVELVRGVQVGLEPAEGEGVVSVVVVRRINGRRSHVRTVGPRRGVRCARPR